ncbi:MAG: RNA recognition motif domain-containing protein [Myxococcota bacterium]
MNNKLYVGNLPFQTTEADLRAAFTEVGAVDRAAVVTDRETGRSRGFGFVEMTNEADANRAVEALNGRSMGGRTMQVNIARPREDRANGGRRESRW